MLKNLVAIHRSEKYNQGAFLRFCMYIKKLVTKCFHSDKPAGLVICSSSTEHANNEEDFNEQHSRLLALIDNLNGIEQKSNSFSLHAANNEEDFSEQNSRSSKEDFNKQHSRSSELVDNMNDIEQKCNSSLLCDDVFIRPVLTVL